MTKPGQPGYTGEPEERDPKTTAPKMVGQTQDDQADNSAKGTGKKAVADEDLSAKAARLESELASVRAQSHEGETVRLKVEGAHSAVIHNGIYVGEEWTEVPAHAAPAIMEGAADAGVSLVQEEV
jgi:hypothetical protein